MSIAKFESQDELIKRAKQIFKEEFDDDPKVCGVAPGRVNLIGEHTDYNDGFVLPMALPMLTVVVGSKGGKGGDKTKCVVVSTDSPSNDTDQKCGLDCSSPPLEEYDGTARPKWANYVKGVVGNFHARDKVQEAGGFRSVVVTAVPLGGGLSSSAALEVAFYTFLEALVDSPAESLSAKALACQKAEHIYANMPCGIMDQFISVMGKEGKAVKIDCRSMKTDLVSLTDPDVVVLVINSNEKHELNGTEYPLRRENCHKAAKILGKEKLRDVNMQQVEAAKPENKEQEKKAKDGKLSLEMYKMARHAVTEIVRTEHGAKALNEGDYESFGEMMIASHESLRDDYAVSTDRLNRLVRAATLLPEDPDASARRRDPDVYGSRMTGGGFGGCTVNLVKKEAVQKVVDRVDKEYEAGKATFYVLSPSNGARVVQI